MSNARPVTTAAQAAEQKSRLLWSGVIVSLLGLQVFGCLLALFLATSSSSMAVIPNYHDKAIHWDEHRATLLASEQLGWQDQIEISGPVDIFENRDITIYLNDADDRPIQTTHLSVQVYRHTNPNEVFVLDFEQAAPGEYVSSLRMTDSGLWEFEVEATRDNSRFVRSRTMEVFSDGPAKVSR